MRMKYNTTVKDFPAIEKEALIYLQSGWEKTVYKLEKGKEKGRVVEVAFSNGGSGFSYMRQECSPALLKRIAAIEYYSP